MPPQPPPDDAEDNHAGAIALTICVTLGLLGVAGFLRGLAVVSRVSEDVSLLDVLCIAWMAVAGGLAAIASLVGVFFALYEGATWLASAIFHVLASSTAGEPTDVAGGRSRGR